MILSFASGAQFEIRADHAFVDFSLNWEGKASIALYIVKYDLMFIFLYDCFALDFCLQGESFNTRFFFLIIAYFF